MTKEMVEGSEKGKHALQTIPLVPNAKDASAYPGNEEGSVQPTTVTTTSETERENAERERTRLEEERKHHEQCGS
jgi:hypothetical protein